MKNNPNAYTSWEDITLGYKKIKPDRARQMIAEGNVTIVDVRSPDEYNTGHLKNAILLPHTQISQYSAAMLPDKNADIIVHCQSGARSGAAGKELLSLGYNNIYDLGGIARWPYELEH